jgi:UDP-N-acetylmuramate dehydrogenase
MGLLPSGLRLDEKIVLKPFSSWLVGGTADYLAQPRDISQLHEAFMWGKNKNLPLTILSGGTNVLISDKGIRGLTILLKKFTGIIAGEFYDPKTGVKRLTLECLAGTSKSELLKTFLKYRLEPAMFLAGIPGDVGGGVVMNAGVGEMLKPREFVELVNWVEVLRPDGSFSRVDKKNLVWSYRHCRGWEPGIISRVALSWPLDTQLEVIDRVRDANQVRLSKQPLDMPSCGSVFINPLPHKSGQLIENSGLKGYTIGGAKVSEKHANFIVNTGSATAADIHAVIEHVKVTVNQKFGVELKTEVVYLGDWTEDVPASKAAK